MVVLPSFVSCKHHGI